MKNKVVLITGGNAGIGKATAIDLARRGAMVVIVSRNEERGLEALREIRKEVDSTNVDLLIADLAGFQSLRHLASAFLAKYERLDVLINNAGVFVSEKLFTKEGFELQFGVNHLGHFLLTSLLLNILKASAPSRILNVSSNSHYRGDIDFDNLRGEKKGYNGMNAYAQSKLANVLFTRELALRLEGTGVTANALHPGVVRTDIGSKHSNFFTRLGWKLFKPFMVSTEKGAETSVFLAASPQVDGVSGKYFANKKEKWPSRKAQDDELARRLWDLSEKIIATSSS